MSWLSKGLKSIGKTVKKVASVANPVAGLAYDVIGGRSLKDAAGRAVGNAQLGQALALKAAPFAGGVGAIASQIPGVSSMAGSIADRVPELARPAVRDILGGRGGAAGPSPAPVGGGGGGVRDAVTGAIRGALGGKPITFGNVGAAITGNDGSVGDWAKLLATAGIGLAGLKAGNDATRNAHDLTKRQIGIGNDLADFGRQSLASASSFRDAAQSPLLAQIAAGPRQPTNFASQFADTLNPYRRRYGAPLMAPPPGGGY